MTSVKSKKPQNGGTPKHGECIPIGDALPPNVSTKELLRIHAQLSGHKTVPKEALIITAVIKRRSKMSVSEIARHMNRPRSTVHVWLVRVRDRGIEGLSDKSTASRKPILGDIEQKVIRIWLSHSPQAYGFESALWQSSILLKMISDRLHIDIKPRTLRATLHRMKISFCKPRPIPHKSATPEVSEKFKVDAQNRIDPLRDTYTLLYQDEATVMLAAATTRGWMPRGGRATVKVGFSKKPVKVFGALGKNKIHVMPAGAANSKVFKIFLEALRQYYGHVIFVIDNASYHKSYFIQDYIKSTNGDVILIYLPPYTPQLNPIEIQWRIIKERLAGRYFASEEELEDAIIKLVESGEVKPVQITNLPIA